MNLFFKIALLFIFLFSSTLQLTAQSRQVIICLDESGSMDDSWDELNYALQTIIALIDEDDELIIIPGGGGSVLNINTKTKAREVEKWYSRTISGNNNESGVIPTANNLIKRNPKKESLLIFIGDGRWSNLREICADLTTTYHAQKPRIIFFKIGVSAISELEAALPGISTLEVIYTPAGNSTILKENLNKLAHKIVEGKEGKVNLSFGGAKVSFKPVFPLKKVIVLLQDSVCTLKDISSGYGLEGPIDITNTDVRGNLEGKVYEIKANGGSVIDAGKEISLRCSNSSCCSASNSNLKFIPIVALDLKNEVEGNFIKSDISKNEYTLCDKETEVTINSFLVDARGKKLNLAGISKLKISADNGSTTEVLTLNGNKATGKIKLVGAITEVTVEANYEGYFQKKSNIFTFIKEDCPLKLDTEVNGNFENKKVSSRVYEVCPSVKNVDLISQILDDVGSIKPFSAFAKVEIYLNAGGKKTLLSKSGDKVLGSLTLDKGNTTAYLTLEINGGEVYKSGNYLFKRVKCGPEKDNTILEIEPTPLMEFIEDGKCIDKIKIVRADGTEIDHRKYTFEVTDVPREFNVIIDTTSTDLRICFEKKPWLCDCFIRHGTFTGMIQATPKDRTYSRVDKPWTFTIQKEENLLVRCKTCLIIALILGLIATYLYGIWTKPRFHSSALFEIVEEDRTSIYAPPNKRPRKRLPTGLFNRYLIPFVAESKIVDGMKFKATDTKTSVLLSRESISDKMSKNGEPLSSKAKRDLKIYRNNTLELEKRQNITTIYTLKVK